MDRIPKIYKELNKQLLVLKNMAENGEGNALYIG